MKKFNKNFNVENLEKTVADLVNVQDCRISVRCADHTKEEIPVSIFYVNGTLCWGDKIEKCSTLHSALNKARKELPSGKLTDVRFNLILNEVEISFCDFGEEE